MKQELLYPYHGALVKKTYGIIYLFTESLFCVSFYTQLMIKYRFLTS